MTDDADPPTLAAGLRCSGCVVVLSRAGAQAAPRRRPNAAQRTRTRICRSSRTPTTAWRATTTSSTPSGEDVSIGATWRSTMMANSARDPYWQAGVRRETIDHPTHAAAIQDECAACHMPMAQRIAQRRAAGKGEVFAHLPIARRDPSDCTGSPPTASRARSAIRSRPTGSARARASTATSCMKPTPPDGARVIFGPYAIDAGRKTIMRSVTGFVQAEAPHIQQSELCASCHTLITEGVRARRRGHRLAARADELSGVAAQRLQPKEQRSCQSCHMPAAPGPDPQRVGARRRARQPGAPRVRRRQRVHGAACSTATAPSSASRRCPRSSRPPRGRRSGSCSRTRRR